MKLSLASPADVQQQLARALRGRREASGLSRRALAELSTVPEPTIKRFETTGEVSLRQLLLLWNCVDDLNRFDAITRPTKPPPRTIDDVLSS